MITLVSLSESDKRVLIALLLVFILLLLLFGYLVKLIKYIVRVQGDFVDKSMYDILDANLIKDKKTFYKISREKNRREFYFEARWPMLAFIVIFIGLLIYQTVIASYSWQFMIDNWVDAWIEFDWPTQQFFGLKIVNDWPTVVKAPIYHFDDFGAWISYIFIIVGAYAFIHFIICTCALMARNYRTFVVGNEYFRKDLKDLKNAKMASGAMAHTKKPTQEMEEMVERDGTRSSN